jgi:hypothetical protein
MTCAELESYICEYAEGGLSPAQRTEVERHLASCAGCAELARDSAAALAFLERVPEVEPPPDLLTHILFEAPWQHKPGASLNWLRRLYQPVLQPRFAMGMAMTILSFAMLARFVAPVRQMRPADLQPGRVWAVVEDRAFRTWERSVKFYENIRFVYQIRSRLREWQQQQQEEAPPAAAEPERPEAGRDERRLPLSAPAENAPASDPDLR